MGIMDKTSNAVGMITAVFALIGGGYAAWDQIRGGLEDKAILRWAPEHFEISDGPADGEFQVFVARQKLRDDCKVEAFDLEVRDSSFNIHPATPSIAKFSGPAGPNEEKFGYKFTIVGGNAAKGKATLLAHITYRCPEGEVMVNYPNHENLTFNIE